MRYRWFPMVNSKELNLRFKVWLNVMDVPPHLWSLDEILKGVGSLGVLLDHASLYHVQSFEKFRILIACKDLHSQPHNIMFVLDGVETKCNLKACSWISELTTFKLPVDTSPSDEYFGAQGVYMEEK
jgi:hypothetical protein